MGRETVAFVKPGDAIGAYRLEAPTGRSQIGETWRALHTQLGSRVRVTLVHLPEQLRASIQETFARRVMPLSQIQATQLDRLIDSGLTIAGIPYFVTEVLAGELLADRLVREPLPPADALELGVEVFAGLEVMHEAGIAHGRVAPARAFLVRTQSIDGPATGLRLLDVGLSYVLQLPASVDADARCLAPELAGGAAPTQAGDVFAAGRLAQLMFGGAAPPEAVAALLTACTAADPEQRPTAASVRSKLAGERDASEGPAPVMGQLVTNATPASGEEGWLGEWESPAATPATAPASVAPTPTPAPQGKLGGWTAPPPTPAPGTARSPALLYGVAALAAAAIVAFVVRAAMIAPSDDPLPDLGPIAVAPPPPDAALVVDAISGEAGKADAGVDPKKAVKIIVSPAGARFTQRDSERVLCDAAAACLVPIDQDTVVELEGYVPVTLSGDDLFDRRGGRWVLRLYPDMPKEKPKKRRRRRRR